ncbi:hypothetical protein AMATHDRAFT_78106 [Amanita thiersii Skay4041]|uniref:Fungal lipase-type domain-containing protein n=1 Tax=Amanita thiersii Skay4041 TaxID=703135 RepID=A0A2A9N9U1_9AGAR|nr:hypothetical protein AMATHDRAFT_78106 [Amanita thiersii Skay4041]
MVKSASILPTLAAHQGPTSTLFSSQIAAYKPYTYFAALASCEPSQTLAWNCGVKCDSRHNFVPVASGGNGDSVQYWYVGYDTSLSRVIVAYQGTDHTKIESLLTNANILFGDLDPVLFPSLRSDIQTHSGFRDAHARSAKDVLAAVREAIRDSGFKTVAVVGNSLGGALALISSVHLRLWLSKSMVINTVTYGMPRVGNQEFVDYVNRYRGNTRITNKDDIVPTLPGRSLGYAHADLEVHIVDNNNWVQCDGQDNTKAECTIGYVENIFNGNFNDHRGK